MRVLLRVMFFVVVSIIFSGCATVNTTLLDSAIPVGAGKMRTDAEVVRSLDLSLLENTLFNYGLKSTIGITERKDVVLRGYVASSSMGVGIYLKHNLFKNEEKKRWVSIVPGINMVKGGRGITIGDSKPLNIGSFGLTIPLIITQGNKQTNKSFIARYSIDWLRVGKTHYPINRFNTSVSFQNKHRHLIVTLELGAEHVFEGSNFVKSVPSIGIALGLPSKE